MPIVLRIRLVAQKEAALPTKCEGTRLVLQFLKLIPLSIEIPRIYIMTMYLQTQLLYEFPQH